jgi:hypothetical protein
VPSRTSNQSGAGANAGVSKETKASGEPRTSREAREAHRGRRQGRRMKAVGPAPRIRFGRRSQMLFGAGGLCIVLGYILLASGSITLAPILLVAGYCVFFPMGILLKNGLGAQREGE